MNFDPTINIGTIISIISVLVGAMIVVSAIRADLKWLAFRVTKLELSTDSMEKAFATLAVQEDRLNAFARRIERLEAHYIGDKQ